MNVLGWVGLGFAGGTTFALALVRGARHTRPLSPFVRTTPRPTDWTNHEGRIA